MVRERENKDISYTWLACITINYALLGVYLITYKYGRYEVEKIKLKYKWLM